MTWNKRLVKLEQKVDFRISVIVKILVQLPVLTQDGREDTAVKNDFVRELDFKTCICVWSSSIRTT